MVDTTPYLAATFAMLEGPITHVVAARTTTAAGVVISELSVRGGTITFDHEWAPHVQAEVTVARPGEFAFPPDPRAAARLVLDLGYERPDGVRDVQVGAANLVLVDVAYDVVDATWRLTAHSDEALVQQAAYPTLADLTTTYASHGAALQDLITRALDPYVPTFATTLTGTSDLMTNYRVAIGASWWPHIESIRDAGAARVYCDAQRVWHIDPDPADAPLPAGALVLRGGPALIPPDPNTLTVVTAASESTTRDEWANTVVVEHVWRDGAGVYQRTARTATATGDYAPATVGTRAQVVRRDTPTTLTACDAEAAAILYRVRRRGDTWTVEGRACYWLRPSHLPIQVDVPGWWPGASLRVTRVQFALDGSGLMTIGGRAIRPDLIP